jgi:hypothetical protein
VPVRSASLDPIDWRNATVTGSWLTGADQVSSDSGLADSGASGLPAPAAGLEACACSGCGSVKAPLARWPGAAVSGSETESVASPAVLRTSAVVDVS